MIFNTKVNRMIFKTTYIISCLDRTDDINSFLNYKFVLSSAGQGVGVKFLMPSMVFRKIK